MHNAISTYGQISTTLCSFIIGSICETDFTDMFGDKQKKKNNNYYYYY